MGIIAKVGTALQGLFGNIAEAAAQTSGVIVRKRKFDGMSLGRTFVLGYLQNPKASDEDLAQIAVQCGVAWKISSFARISVSSSMLRPEPAAAPRMNSVRGGCQRRRCSQQRAA